MDTAGDWIVNGEWNPRFDETSGQNLGTSSKIWWQAYARIFYANGGTLATPTHTFKDQTQTGMYLHAGGSNPEVGLVGGGATMFKGKNPSSGADEVRILPAWANSSSGDATLGVTSTGLLRRQTSARKYKSRITYNVVDRLAALPLRPAKFYRKDHGGDTENADRGSWFYDFIADDFADAEPLLAIYDTDSGDVEGYRVGTPAVIAAAKLIVAERERGELAAKVTELAARVATLERAA
jgi:hypothetical protein